MIANVSVGRRRIAQVEGALVSIVADFGGVDWDVVASEGVSGVDCGTVAEIACAQVTVVAGESRRNKWNASGVDLSVDPTVGSADSVGATA